LTGVIGRDITAYRNHTYRVLNLCVAQSSNALEQLEKIAIAAAFHDLGIWTDSTFRLSRAVARVGAIVPRSIRQAGLGAGSLGDDFGAPQDHAVSRPSGLAGWAVSTLRLGRC